MWVGLEPLTYKQSPVETHIVPDDNIINSLWIISVIWWNKLFVEVIKEGQQQVCVIGTKMYMAVQDTMVIYCCTHGYVPTTLAGDPNNGPLAYDISSPAPSLGQIKPSLIYENIFI